MFLAYVFIIPPYIFLIKYDPSPPQGFPSTYLLILVRWTFTFSQPGPAYFVKCSSRTDNFDEILSIFYPDSMGVALC